MTRIRFMHDHHTGGGKGVKKLVGRRKRLPHRSACATVGDHAYFSQMVMGGALAVPRVSSTAASPGATKPPGTMALICSTPIMPGALPANRIWAFTPAMVKTMGCSGCG